MIDEGTVQFFEAKRLEHAARVKELSAQIKVLEEERGKLEGERRRERERRNYYQRKLYDPAVSYVRNGSEPLGVAVVEIIPVIQRWKLERGKGAMKELAYKSGIPAGTIRRILRRDRRWVTLTTADNILTAVGCVHLIQDGTIKVVPNPAFEPRVTMCDD